MTRSSYDQPLRLTGLDSWITREEQPWEEFPPTESDPCECCAGEGELPRCEAENSECVCQTQARTDCAARCPACDGRGWK